jgi:hypothetical protein
MIDYYVWKTVDEDPWVLSKRITTYERQSGFFIESIIITTVKLIVN